MGFWFFVDSDRRLKELSSFLLLRRINVCLPSMDMERLLKGKRLLLGVLLGVCFVWVCLIWLATEAFVIAPFELVKIKLQAAGSSQLYANTFDAVVKIVRNTGIRSIYKGIESTLWRNITWNGGYFGLISQIRSRLPDNSHV